MPGNASLASCARIDLNFTHTFLPPAFVVVFVVGTLANIWGLRSVCAGWSRVGSIGVFMLHLGAADLLYLATLPFLVDYYARRSRWRFGEPFCKVTRFCFNLNLYGSIGFLTCIGVHRYLGIVHPLRTKGRISSRRSQAVAALVWLSVCAQILPDAFFDKSDPDRPGSCFDTTSDELVRAYLPYSIAWTATGFAVPLGITLACYGHIAAVLAGKANVEPQLRRRCLRLVAVLVLLFSVCFVPYHVFRNANLTVRILKLDGVCHGSFRGVYVAHQVGRFLACLNSVINPLIYVVVNDEFLARLRRVTGRARRSLVGLTAAVVRRTPEEADDRDGADDGREQNLNLNVELETSA